MNMLSPKKTKFRKQFKGRIHGNAKGNYSLNYGSFGLKAMEPERVTSRQIEAARKAILSSKPSIFVLTSLYSECISSSFVMTFQRIDRSSVARKTVCPVI